MFLMPKTTLHMMMIIKQFQPKLECFLIMNVKAIRQLGLDVSISNMKKFIQTIKHQIKLSPTIFPLGKTVEIVLSFTHIAIHITPSKQKLN